MISITSKVFQYFQTDEGRYLKEQARPRGALHYGNQRKTCQFYDEVGPYVFGIPRFFSDVHAHVLVCLSFCAFKPLFLPPPPVLCFIFHRIFQSCFTHSTVGGVEWKCSGDETWLCRLSIDLFRTQLVSKDFKDVNL